MRSAVFIILTFFLASFSGCFGEDLDEESVIPKITVDDVSSAIRGQYMSIAVDSTVDWTVNRSPGLFFMDEFGVLRDAEVMTFPASQETLDFLVMDSERDDIQLEFTAGEEIWNVTLMLEDSSEMMLVDGRRAYETADMLTSQYNNRWCASASIHEGGAAYENAAEAMEDKMWDMGFDHVEITRYPDDPDQLNIVGYNWGRVNPDEYIVIGGHFDICLLYTSPSPRDGLLSRMPSSA